MEGCSSSFITALSKRSSGISRLRQFAPSTKLPVVLWIMNISVERSTEIAQSIKSGIANKQHWSLYALLNRHCAEPLSRKSRHRATKAGWAGGAACGGFATQAFQPETTRSPGGRRQYRTPNPDGWH